MIISQLLKKFLTGFVWMSAAVLSADQEPQVVYLTWVKDPSTTMTVQWLMGTGEGPSRVSYGVEGQSSRVTVEGRVSRVSEIDMHRADLEKLKEDTTYVFKIGDSPEYRFRTLPKSLKRPVRLAIGGDIFYPGETDRFEKMNRVIASQDPDVVILGGDLAYTHGTKHFKGTKAEMARWRTFLKELQRTVRGANGRLIPILPVVGNHDVKKGEAVDASGLFYELFAFPQPGCAYRMFDAGNYLSLALLDTGHSHPIEGEQAAWLEKNLKARRHIPHIWSAYHIAAYPSYYPYDGEKPVKIRTHWVPLFEKYRISLAFEHHNHRFKRTYAIKGGQRNTRGVIYLGDGSWGVGPRGAADPDSRWYLDRSESVNACYFVTLSRKGINVEARNLEGEVIDRLD